MKYWESSGSDSTGSLARLDDQTKLPFLPLDLLEASLKRLAPEDFDLALKHRLVPTAWLPHRIYYAAAGRCAYQKARDHNLKIVAQIEPADFRRAVKRVLGKRLAEQARDRLHMAVPEMSNKSGIPMWQRIALTGGLLLVTLPIVLLPQPLLAVHAGLLASLFFLSIVALRLMCLLPRARSEDVAPAQISEDLLPCYSVLVPLYKEVKVLGQLVGALMALDYPHEKIDIKLILEENDTAMQRAVAELILDERFDIIVVPHGAPQTKPRALNYALFFARGELLTIYDAEDLPEPQQLRLAAAGFVAESEDVACLQAELAFFNAEENWLSKQFAAEYASLFNVVLPSLAFDRLPMPLGGTSNHFRREALERVGAWDPYNVTEDADLGARLSRFGYVSGVVKSTTYEEANIHLGSWIKQRSRWLKGFLLTWLVHMRQPLVLWRSIGLTGMWAFSAMTLGVFLSALLHPFFLARLLVDQLIMPRPVNAPTYDSIILGASLLLFASSYVISFLTARKGLARQQFAGWRKTLWTMPVYWLLLAPAAGIALYESYFRPFHWRKTAHGVSTCTQRRVIEP